MNIHFINGQNVPTAKFRQTTGLKLDRSGTQEPRKRENIGKVPSSAKAGQRARIASTSTHLGGKLLRRASAALEIRRADYDRLYHPGAKGGKGVSGEGYLTKPGSMK